MSSGNRISEIIHDTNKLFRSKTTDIELETVSIHQLARDMWDQLETSRAELVIEDQIAVECDPGQCKLLFENLFKNSIEHNDEPLTITIGSVESGTGFYVCDTGSGIPPDIRDNIFQHGYSGEGSSGIGMTIVSTVVERHDWSIDIDDEYTEGAKFNIKGVTQSEVPETGIENTGAENKGVESFL